VTAPAAKPTVVSVEVGGERVLLDTETGKLHLLDRVASVVWPFLDGTATVDELAADVADAFGEPVERVRADLGALVGRLAEEGLLAGTGEPAPDDEPPPGPRMLVDPPSG
jgi:hypothetical protein